MVEVGDSAPEFEGPSSLGGNFKLSEHKGHPVVVYFYPAASTPGCRIETKAFQDLHAEFQKRHVTLVGVSVDSPEAEAKFAGECATGFGLVADSKGSIATAYGVMGPSGRASRVTFLLAPDGKVVEKVSGSPLTHVERAKARFLSG
ncbi:MAG: peroxiredoxin [Thermoplasmata archaeon]|nr:peroxiredoxin [Thermoplasmata archaeon]